jgi:hypothetical protein
MGGWILGIAYGLDVRGIGVQARNGLIFLFSTAFIPRSWTTLSLVKWVPGDLSTEVKQVGRKASHSPPPSSKVKKAWSYTFTPHTLTYDGSTQIFKPRVVIVHLFFMVFLRY